jgi:hypothetical protein
MLPFKSIANENENPNLSNIATNLTEKFSYSIKCKFNFDKKNEFPYYKENIQAMKEQEVLQLIYHRVHKGRN